MGCGAQGSFKELSDGPEARASGKESQKLGACLEGWQEMPEVRVSGKIEEAEAGQRANKGHLAKLGTQAKGQTSLCCSPWRVQTNYAS